MVGSVKRLFLTNHRGRVSGSEQCSPNGEHEVKFPLDNSRAHIVHAWLRRRCRPDAEFASSIVSSIYYDTPDWSYLYEKMNSDYLKTKFRIRWYSDLASGVPGKASFVEAKFKTGSRRSKRRLRCDLSGADLSQMSLNDSRLRRAIRELRRCGVDVPESVFAVFQIDYCRQRYVDPTSGARLSLDYNIRVARGNSRAVPRGFPGVLDCAVFELKGAASVLPDFLHQVTALGCRKQSFSKYSSCYCRAMQVAV
jgi:hypothetical protein